MRIGAHVGAEDPLGEGARRDADCVQLFLSDPKSWRKPEQRTDEATLRNADTPLYVHAPYLVNVASTNNRVRVPSRKILQQTCDAAEAIRASGVVVHGGYVDDAADPEEGFENWRKALERLETDMPVLIENTAGGRNAMARSFERLEALWERLGGLEVGFCFDTCHAHAAGEELAGSIERLRASIGRIDLVHANDSRDVLGSGRDRHANLGTGEIDSDALVELCGAAQAPLICETPGDAEAQAGDIHWLRQRLSHSPG